MLDFGGTYSIKVSIGQFYGIEINDFAVTVAKTALWISEEQMIRETQEIIHSKIDFLPLKSYASIVQGNALRIDWADIVPKEKMRYIMGNPPFLGHQWRSEAQTRDLDIVFYDLKKHGKLDYVTAWYQKAADYMQNTTIVSAFVSTNSIVQGESVSILWEHLMKKGVEIKFAHSSFVWDSEAIQKAHVHCVIIGFACYSDTNGKHLYENEHVNKVAHINGYLLNAPDVYITSRGKQLSKGLPSITKGSQPTDGGYLIMSEEEKCELLSQYPSARTLIRRYMGSYELINDKVRYCLWLKDVPPSNYRNIHPIMKRLEAVRDFRKNSATESVRRDAETPMLFTQIRQPSSDYLAMPKVSSERRRYIPIAYLRSNIISSDLLYMIPNATMYMFGILNSNVHMAWMRVVCGRLKSDYRYGPVVYNNFPWPSPSLEQKVKIEQTAQGILDARALYPDSSLADLYDPLTMPPELRKAHDRNNAAVMKAYGFSTSISEADCVAALMKMYQELTKKA